MANQSMSARVRAAQESTILAEADKRGGQAGVELRQHVSLLKSSKPMMQRVKEAQNKAVAEQRESILKAAGEDTPDARYIQSATSAFDTVRRFDWGDQYAYDVQTGKVVSQTDILRNAGWLIEPGETIEQAAQRSGQDVDDFMEAARMELRLQGLGSAVDPTDEGHAEYLASADQAKVALSQSSAASLSASGEGQRGVDAIRQKSLLRGVQLQQRSSLFS